MSTPSLTVVADVDTGIDDALALIYLYRLHLAGRIDLSVTTSAGNCTADDAARNSAEVFRVAAQQWGPSSLGRHRAQRGEESDAVIPKITIGAAHPRVLPLVTTPETHGPRGLGYWLGESGDARRAQAEGTPGKAEAPLAPGSGTPDGTAAAAVAHWADAQPTHLLVCGPATNLAWAVEHAPEVLRGCQVVIMGGAFGYPGNTTPVAEWNAWVDPHALKYALQHWPEGAPLPVIAPLNMTEQVLLTPERLRDWVGGLDARQETGRQADRQGDLESAQAVSQLGQLLTATVEFYFEFHEQVGVGYQAQIHDLAAAMVLLGDVAFEATEFHVDVEADSELTRGATLAFDPNPPFGPQLTPNARVLGCLDAGGVLERFGELLVGKP
ncbi:nucleoside hydrolase [Corynebacterium sp. MSK039]|uniref:nucleoside hydrolase n=1 Tax=Corynebacterium sp. MSK039 TaxID=3050193 RepID=UPI00254D2339|nr:nucleoside hydrolase [Corynebacterium sp. MSK039]MDK8790910.1 nucleoside hydrolase [Corynebacterium sp. MSK039]